MWPNFPSNHTSMARGWNFQPRTPNVTFPNDSTGSTANPLAFVPPQTFALPIMAPCRPVFSDHQPLPHHFAAWAQKQGHVGPQNHQIPDDLQLPPQGNADTNVPSAPHYFTSAWKKPQGVQNNTQAKVRDHRNEEIHCELVPIPSERYNEVDRRPRRHSYVSTGYDRSDEAPDNNSQRHVLDRLADDVWNNGNNLDGFNGDDYDDRSSNSDSLTERLKDDLEQYEYHNNIQKNSAKPGSWDQELHDLKRVLQRQRSEQQPSSDVRTTNDQELSDLKCVLDRQHSDQQASETRKAPREELRDLKRALERQRSEQESSERTGDTIRRDFGSPCHSRRDASRRSRDNSVGPDCVDGTRFSRHDSYKERSRSGSNRINERNNTVSSSGSVLGYRMPPGGSYFTRHIRSRSRERQSPPRQRGRTRVSTKDTRLPEKAENKSRSKSDHKMIPKAVQKTASGGKTSSSVKKADPKVNSGEKTDTKGNLAEKIDSKENSAMKTDPKAKNQFPLAVEICQSLTATLRDKTNVVAAGGSDKAVAQSALQQRSQKIISGSSAVKENLKAIAPQDDDRPYSPGMSFLLSDAPLSPVLHLDAPASPDPEYDPAEDPVEIAYVPQHVNVLEARKPSISLDTSFDESIWEPQGYEDMDLELPDWSCSNYVHEPQEAIDMDLELPEDENRNYITEAQRENADIDFRDLDSGDEFGSEDDENSSDGEHMVMESEEVLRARLIAAMSGKPRTDSSVVLVVDETRSTTEASSTTTSTLSLKLAALVQEEEEPVATIVQQLEQVQDPGVQAEEPVRPQVPQSVSFNFGSLMPPSRRMPEFSESQMRRTMPKSVGSQFLVNITGSREQTPTRAKERKYSRSSKFTGLEKGKKIPTIVNKSLQEQVLKGVAEIVGKSAKRKRTISTGSSAKKRKNTEKDGLPRVKKIPIMEKLFGTDEKENSVTNRNAQNVDTKIQVLETSLEEAYWEDMEADHKIHNLQMALNAAMGKRERLWHKMERLRSEVEITERLVNPEGSRRSPECRDRSIARREQTCSPENRNESPDAQTENPSGQVICPNYLRLPNWNSVEVERPISFAEDPLLRTLQELKAVRASQKARNSCRSPSLVSVDENNASAERCENEFWSNPLEFVHLREQLESLALFPFRAGFGILAELNPFSPAYLNEIDINVSYCFCGEQEECTRFHLPAMKIERMKQVIGIELKKYVQNSTVDRRGLEHTEDWSLRVDDVLDEIAHYGQYERQLRDLWLEMVQNVSIG